jgi:hypothetical protein
MRTILLIIVLVKALLFCYEMLLYFEYNEQCHNIYNLF